MGLHVPLTSSAKMSGRVSRAPHDRVARFASRSLGLPLRTCRQSSYSTPDNSDQGLSQSPRRAAALQLHPCIRCVLHTDAGVRQSAIDRGQGHRPTGCQYGFGTRFVTSLRRRICWMSFALEVELLPVAVIGRNDRHGKPSLLQRCGLRSPNWCAGRSSATSHEMRRYRLAAFTDR